MAIKKVAAVPRMIDLVNNEFDKSVEMPSGSTSARYHIPTGLSNMSKKPKPSPGTVQAPLLRYLNKNKPK